jgi:hypothetical protein
MVMNGLMKRSVVARTVRVFLAAIAVSLAFGAVALGCRPQPPPQQGECREWREWVAPQQNEEGEWQSGYCRDTGNRP